MTVVVIGGTGHIGSFLVPRLVEAGHHVLCVSRRQRSPYVSHDAWNRVEHAVIDRGRAESEGQFGRAIAALVPEIVVDLTCYTVESATQLAEALTGRVAHLLHCGTIWVHGPGGAVPTTEDEPRRPFGDYGRRKAAIERYLIDLTKHGSLPSTVLHPGHLVGPGWMPINPAGNFDVKVFDDLGNGRLVRLPQPGTATLHHVHVDDVAQAFVQAIAHPRVSIGESFHVVSPRAMTMREYADQMADWFGTGPTLQWLPYAEWRADVSERDAAITLDHIQHSSNCSIDKARARLGYAPRYDSLAAVQESVAWLMRNRTPRPV